MTENNALERFFFVSVGGGGAEDDGGEDADVEGLADASTHAKGGSNALVDDSEESDGDKDEDEGDEDGEKQQLQREKGTASPLPPSARNTANNAASSSSPAPPARNTASPAPLRTGIRLLPMHSLISFEDQMAAFAPASQTGDARTRVVVATNIAESSITLPDVHTVIDFG